MVTPNNFFAKVGDIEAYFTHAIHVRESVPPIVNLFYGCVPVIIKVGLEIWGTFVPLVCVVKVSALVTICHLIISRNLASWFIIETLEC